MGYGKLKRAEAAAIMAIEPATLDRIMGTKGPETKLATWQQLWRLAEHVGLPPEWFSADLTRLDEIVPPGLPTVVKARGADEDAGTLDLVAGRKIKPPRSRKSA